MGALARETAHLSLTLLSHSSLGSQGLAARHELLLRQDFDPYLASCSWPLKPPATDPKRQLPTGSWPHFLTTRRRDPAPRNTGQAAVYDSHTSPAARVRRLIAGVACIGDAPSFTGVFSPFMQGSRRRIQGQQAGPRIGF
jgi:hypothetical protein